MKYKIFIAAVALIASLGFIAYLVNQSNQTRSAFGGAMLRLTESNIGRYITTRTFYGDDAGNGTPNTVSTISFNNENYCEDAGDEPLIIAEMFMKANLRSPSTSQFSNFLSRLGDEPCHYRVSGYVDSQNGFGAMVRTNFTFTMRFDPELRKWRDLDAQTY